jgi:hypothetical protein
LSITLRLPPLRERARSTLAHRSSPMSAPRRVVRSPDPLLRSRCCATIPSPETSGASQHHGTSGRAPRGGRSANICQIGDQLRRRVIRTTIEGWCPKVIGRSTPSHPRGARSDGYNQTAARSNRDLAPHAGQSSQAFGAAPAQALDQRRRRAMSSARARAENGRAAVRDAGAARLQPSSPGTATPRSFVSPALPAAARAAASAANVELLRYRPCRRRWCRSAASAAALAATAISSPTQLYAAGLAQAEQSSVCFDRSRYGTNRHCTRRRRNRSQRGAVLLVWSCSRCGGRAHGLHRNCDRRSRSPWRSNPWSPLRCSRCPARRSRCRRCTGDRRSRSRRRRSRASPWPCNRCPGNSRRCTHH